ADQAGRDPAGGRFPPAGGSSGGAEDRRTSREERAMKIVRGVVTLGAAALAQSLLSHYGPALAGYCDLFTIVVVYYGLTCPPPAAMMMGTAAGLVEDSLLHSILGMNGLTKTLITYLVGSTGELVMLCHTSPSVRSLA